MRNVLFLVVFLFTSCSFKPDMPKLDEQFAYSMEKSNVSQKWWEDFKDQKLNALIKQALKHNSNLALASLNMQSARESLNLAKKDFLPHLNLKAGANKSKDRAKSFSLSAMLSYEIDLWGRVRQSSNAKQSLFKASKYDYDGARISLSASVAKTYFLLRAYLQEKDILLKNMKTYKNTMLYQQEQFSSGAISELEYLKSASEYQNAKVKLSSIKNNIEITQSALALLVGKKLDDILYKRFATKKFVDADFSIPSGVSLDVLSSRADIASAYERLKASNHLVGVARSSYLPSISLTGLFGYGSNELNTLLRPSSSTWSLGAELASSLLDFGRVGDRVDMAKLRQDEAFVKYEMTVKSALSELRNALSNYKYAHESKKDIDILLAYQTRIYQIAQESYKEGEITQLQFLDAQRMLLNVQIHAVESKLAYLNSIIDTYKAFGGGMKYKKD